ncbi:RNA polymerase sigma C factor [Bacillus sp. SG-1]|nr:sigma-70 family RNA polymerase sigma factor [Bacillus sp. SG-1]EDL65908.1 RNA polymerase sigma C factor [Bacillus sp. SG-1]
MNKSSFSTDDAFFEYIFHHYSDDVLRLVFTYVKKKDIAEDLVQEIFIKCYKNMDKFQEKSSIKTWIFSITINQCKDYLKSAYYKYIYLSDKISAIAKGGTKTPEELFMEEYGKHRLTTEILNLSLKYREVISLYYFQELKIKEIANVLAINENTVKSRLARAKELLKKNFEERGYKDGENFERASERISNQ